MIVKLPMPPTSNNIYIPVNGRLIKSAEGRRYDSSIEYEKLRQFRLFREINQLFKDRIIRADIYYLFFKDRVIGKKGQIKSLDYSNRQKPSQDALSKCTDIDDKYIKSGFQELILCDNQKDEGVVFVLSIQEKIKTLHELKEQLTIKV